MREWRSDIRYVHLVFVREETVWRWRTLHPQPTHTHNTWHLRNFSSSAVFFRFSSELVSTSFAFFVAGKTENFSTFRQVGACVCARYTLRHARVQFIQMSRYYTQQHTHVAGTIVVTLNCRRHETIDVARQCVPLEFQYKHNELPVNCIRNNRKKWQFRVRHYEDRKDSSSSVHNAGVWCCCIMFLVLPIASHEPFLRSKIYYKKVNSTFVALVGSTWIPFIHSYLFAMKFTHCHVNRNNLIISSSQADDTHCEMAPSPHCDAEYDSSAARASFSHLLFCLIFIWIFLLFRSVEMNAKPCDVSCSCSDDENTKSGQFNRLIQILGEVIRSVNFFI